MNLIGSICRVFVYSVIVAIAGCGSGVKPIANLVPCQGTVTLDSKPLDRGTVAFEPDAKTGQPAVGQIEKDGKFTMMTTASAPGVVVGKYKVRIASTQGAKTVDPTQPFPKSVSLVPEKYTAIKTSGLEVDVKLGMPPVKLDLTSK